MEESILKLKKVAELREIAKAYGIDGCDKMKKAEIIAAIMGNSEDTDEKIQVEEIENVKDADKISKAIVIILYMLRCCLAHGDISPDESANKVYKYAYEILTTPLKKLR